MSDPIIAERIKKARESLGITMAEADSVIINNTYTYQCVDYNV